MKKIIIGLVGCGVVVGVGIIAYTLYKKEKANKQNSNFHTFSADVIDNDCSCEVENSKSTQSKEKSIESISQRHKEASKIIKNSMEVIFSEDDEGSSVEEFRDVSKELNDILKEIDE